MHPIVFAIRRRRVWRLSFVLVIGVLSLVMLHKYTKPRASTDASSGQLFEQYLSDQRQRKLPVQLERSVNTLIEADHKLPAILPVAPTKEEQTFFNQIRPSWGMEGQGVQLSDEEQAEADQQFSLAAFNVFVSDRMPLNRSLVDPRHSDCKTVNYPVRKLPKASVIIIFTDEIFSTLLRTIITTIMRSPPELLKEVILVDDFSTRSDLKERLERFISHHFRPGIVRLIRLTRRSGLIRARLAGAKVATGDVLIFLDSHCETTEGWLEPLLYPIYEDRRAVVCPVIDIIDDKTMQYVAAEGDHFQIGGFNWRGEFVWQNIPQAWKQNRASKADPMKSPTMAGGLFAINREYFWESGSYDEEMDGWGGENLEMSFRIWQCGGKILIAPCSHVGHIFRDYHPYKFPAGKDTSAINTKRAVEVWMDGYKKYFYLMRPELKDMQVGGLSGRKRFRELSECKSFKWYLENVYPHKYISEEHSRAHGIIRNPETNSCIDTYGKSEDRVSDLGLFQCHPIPEEATNQLLSLSRNGEIRKDDICARVQFTDSYHRKGKVVMDKCEEFPRWNQIWSHVIHGQIIHKASGLCIQAEGADVESLFVTQCSESPLQKWSFHTYNLPRGV
ncbi:polypeptide N-acetylgalactosaminyltransferase 13-like [Tropilaelaps mercedesae]|uniref:Polypeptide N-acetylgalactosaminyltransferase n=1 Tax=Tropilaelaps mercedesae TaxID=418985 RepID=A0A1V9XRJ9_9ACAR|nr:polypeptide N-acetylgalactosaminyltransferase 13-like [Tropilaelaps mercedesae]